MKVIYKNNTVFIADDSEAAEKIRLGHDFHVDPVTGMLVIDGMGTGEKNKYQIRKKLDKATDVNDLKKIIMHMLDLMDA